MKRTSLPESRAFTLIELMIVVGIIAFLAIMSAPVYSIMQEKAVTMNHVANVKTITMQTLRWATENNQTLPSPQYPGGHNESDPAIPEQWDFAGTGSGLWLDGVVYYATMIESQSDGVTTVDAGENGKHLRDTVFFSRQSFKKNQLDDNMYHHSYAMNKDLKYDYLYKDSSNPELTNKNLARITHRPAALLYIENKESNVIGHEDIEAIVATGAERRTSKRVISSYLDGSASQLGPNDIPSESPTEDPESSHFWRGVGPD